jgi:hypothetical protein
MCLLPGPPMISNSWMSSNAPQFFAATSAAQVRCTLRSLLIQGTCSHSRGMKAGRVVRRSYGETSL